MDDTDELIDLALTASQPAGSDNRPNVYWDDEVKRWVYRASSLGNCSLALIYDRMGFAQSEPPDMMKKAWAQGNLHELPIIQKFREEYGFTVVDDLSLAQYGTLNQERGQIECEIPIGRNVVRCHPDGVVQCYKTTEHTRRQYGLEIGDRFVLEVKAFAASTYAKWKAEGWAGFPYYEWQFATEMISTGLPGVFCIGVKEELDDGTTEISFIDVQFYTEPPKGKIDIVKRVMEIERGANAAEAGDGLPNDGLCEYAQFPCGHFQRHKLEGVHAPDAAANKRKAAGEKRGVVEWVNPNEAEPTVEQMAIMEFNRAKTLEGQFKSAKDDVGLKDIFTGVKGDWWDAGPYEVWIEGKVGAMDWSKVQAQMKSDGIDVDKYVNDGNRKAGSTWVSVKEKKKGEDE